MHDESHLSRRMVLLLAVAVGILVANLYYMQPIVGVVAHSLGIAPASAGFVVTLIQAGYGLSVLFLVPLGDVLENKKLILSVMFLAFLGVLGLSFSQSEMGFFVSAIVTGVGISCVQAIVPYVASLSSEDKRGQVVGSIMSGLMFGIMLSRPISSFLTDLFSWHAVFILSASLLFVLILVLMYKLPERKPSSERLSYFQLIKSMPQLFMTSSVLRRRSIYQALLFATFCIFWTASSLYLLSSEFSFTHSQVAIFALVGVAGGIVSPLAGRAADRGHSQLATFIALSACVLAYGISFVFEPGTQMSIIALGVSAIVLDAGVSMNLVVGQRTIFSLRPEFRGRLNGIYIATIFIGGAIGSLVGVWSFEKGGWPLTSAFGAAMPFVALVLFFTEPKRAQVAVSTSVPAQ